MNLKNLITRDIDDKFCYIQYDSFKLIMMKENNYINASKLCKLGGREFRNWKRLDGSVDLVDKISKENNKIGVKLVNSSLSDHNTKIIIKIENEGKLKYEVSGSYVHQDLIPHIASWVSSDFAIKVSKIINSYIMKTKDDVISILTKKLDELKTQSENSIETYKKGLEELKSQSKKEYKAMRSRYREQKIELKKYNEDLKLQNNKLINKMDKIDNKNNKLLDKIDSLDNKNNKLLNKIENLENKLNDRVINPFKFNKKHILLLLQNIKDNFKFKILRIQEERKNKEINKYKDFKLIHSNYEPNPISCFNNIKEVFKNFIDYSYNDIYVIDINKIDTFITYFKDLNTIRKL